MNIFLIEFCFLWLVLLSYSAWGNLNDTLADFQDELQIDINTRVINGQDADLHEYPWQVSLEYNGQHVCGGSLIKPSWILTAAHCFIKLRYLRYWKVVVGRHTITGVTRFESRYSVQSVFIHSHYHAKLFNNDVALMHLHGSVPLNKYVNVVQMPQQGQRVTPGTVCFITGWGKLNGMIKKVAHVLQEAPLTVASFSHCSNINSPLPVPINDKTMICAGGGGKGGCHGDSGGPLACNEHGRWILRGIVSWGQEHCSVDFYTVFARVSSFVRWADNIIANNKAAGSCGGIVCFNGGAAICVNGVATCRCRPGYYGSNCQSSQVQRFNISLKCYTCYGREANCKTGILQCKWPNTRCAKVNVGKSVIKGCATPQTCYCANPDRCNTHCCSTNLCNQSTQTRPMFLIAVVCWVVRWTLV